jgi:ATP adenylyltransferase
MDIIWAPWRMKYIKSNNEKNRKKECVFCEKLSNKKDDKKNYILFRNKFVCVIMNIYPYNNGHLMVVVNRHVRDFTGLTQEEIYQLGNMIKLSLKIIKKVMKPNGFNIGINIGYAGGAGVVNHLHVHIVPRWIGDSNFMPVIGKTKVICELLDDTYSKLRKEFLNININNGVSD